MIAANWHLVSVGVGSWTGAGAFVVVAVLAFLLNRERPRALWAHLALLSFVEFTICGLGLAMGVQNLAALPLWPALHGGRTTMLAAAEVLRFWLKRSEPQTAADQTGGLDNSRWVGTILAAIPRSAIVLTFVADWLGLHERRTYLAQWAGVLAGIGVILVGDAAGPVANVGLPRDWPSSWRARWTSPRARSAGTTRPCWPDGSRSPVPCWDWHSGRRAWYRGDLVSRSFTSSPVLQTVWVLRGAAMIAATGHIVFAGAGSWLGAGAFAATTALALLAQSRSAARDLGTSWLFWASSNSRSAAWVWRWVVSGLAAHQYGLLFMADGLALLAAAEVLRVWLNRVSPPADVDLASAWSVHDGPIRF